MESILNLEAKAETQEEFFGVLKEVRDLHACGSVRYYEEDLRVVFEGKENPTKTGLLLNIFTTVKEHHVTVRRQT